MERVSADRQIENPPGPFLEEGGDGARVTGKKRKPVSSASSDAMASAQITGTVRFDFELEDALRVRGWLIKLNQLSGGLEIHRSEGVVPLSDERLSEIRFTLKHATNGKEPAKDKVADALALIGERRAYHPVRAYLGGLKWDGVPRLDLWLVQYAGAADTALHRAFGRKMLCAAVRRVRVPGCKFDHILVLQGSQDLGKSSLIRALCHDPHWFTDQAKVGADAKETIERTAGGWLIEFAELDGLGKRDANAVKSFITTTSDRARPAFGRYTVDRPRQFVLFGTTNERSFLNDLTGNRRWWVVPVTGCNAAALSDVRDQLWAEAVAAEPNEALWLDDPALKAAAEQGARSVIDNGPWFDLLAGIIPEGNLKVSASDAWSMVGMGTGDINKISPAHRTSLRKALAGLGFDPETKNLRRPKKDCPKKSTEQTACYVRGDAAAANWWTPQKPVQDYRARW